VVCVEGVYTTERDLDSPPSCWKTAPTAELRPANYDFNQNGVISDMPALDLDFQVGQRLHELLIESLDPVAARVVFAPGLIVVARGIAECSQNTFKIVRVLKANVFLDDCNAGRTSVFWCSG